MRIRRVPTRREGNQLWPLPADYHTLTEDGQRLARVNAVGIWQVPGTTVERQDAMEASVWFFDHHYLHPDPDDDFDPLYYADPPVATAAFHRAMWRAWGIHRACLDVFPRGAAKSTSLRTSLFPLLLTRNYSVTYATSSHDNAEFTGHTLKTQLRENRRIADDFGPEFPGGRIVPKRGQAAFGSGLLYLTNQSWVRMLSAESKQRGGRPNLYALDDPEFDPKASTSMEVLRAYMSQLIFKIVIPMITRPNTGVRWTATFVSKQHLAWYAMETVRESDGKVRARDPRFDHWHRMLVRSEWADAEGKSHSCWPEMWPLTERDKAKDPSLADRMSLERIREMIGPAVYNSEYLGKPGESGEAYFPPLTEERHGWSLTVTDGHEGWDSKTEMEWMNSKGERVRCTQEDICRRCWVFVTADTSYTHRDDSDWKVCTCMALTPDNELLVLDTWGGKVPESRLVLETLRMADRWHARSIHPEVVSASVNFYHALDGMVKQRATELTGTTWLPTVVPLKVSNAASKAARISTLFPRFEHSLVKLPLWRRWDPHWVHLFDQIGSFNPEARDGGLQHDDHLDTLGMSTIVLKGRPTRPYHEVIAVEDPLDEMRKGRTHDRGGNLLLSRLDFNALSVDDVLGMMQTPRTGADREQPI